MPKNKVRIYRTVESAAGPVRYIDSGWTDAEWSLIRRAMARCEMGGAKSAPRDPDPEPLILLCPFCGGESVHSF